MATSRTPDESFTEMTELVLPGDANVLGSVFGGQVMAWVDICAAITAQRHCGRIAVTAAVDDLQFLAPIRVGDIVRLTARLNEAFGSSMEIEVDVEVEDPRTRVRTLCVQAYLTFVCLDQGGAPLRVPSLTPRDEDDEQRKQAATDRRRFRLERRRSR
jgi:acyl-CoA hydrolase